MMAQSVDALSVDHNTLKYQPDKEFHNDLSKRGDNVGNNLELLDRTRPDNNSLMRGSARGDQVYIGQGDSIAVVQHSMEKRDPIAGIDSQKAQKLDDSTPETDIKMSLNLFGSQSEKSLNNNDNPEDIVMSALECGTFFK